MSGPIAGSMGWRLAREEGRGQGRTASGSPLSSSAPNLPPEVSVLNWRSRMAACGACDECTEREAALIQQWGMRWHEWAAAIVGPCLSKFLELGEDATDPAGEDIKNNVSLPNKE